MALIWSTYWPTADKLGPDLEKMNRVVEVDDEIARVRAGGLNRGDLPGDGTARWPTAEEVADYEAQQQVEQKADEVAADGGDLTKLTKAELLAHADTLGVEGVDESMTKPKIAKAIEDHQAAQSPDSEAEPGDAPAEATV